ENANIDAMPYFEPNSDSLFQKEIKNYPENYKAYGIYFTKIIPPPYSDELNKALNKYLPFLEGLYEKKPNNQGVIYSLCIGYAKNKEISKSKSLLYKLIDDFPGSPLTNNALSIYGYESFKAGNNPAVDNEIISLLSDKFKLDTEYPVCKQNIYLLEKDSTLNRNLFIEALESLVKDDSLDYSSKIKLAEYYLNNEEYDKAEVLIEKTINFLLHSGIKYKWNARNSYLKKELARAYEVRARVRAKKLDYVNAYSSINSAIELLKDDQNGNVVFEYKRFRANLYLKFDNLAMAEEEYAVLYLTEDKEAKAGLLDIYKITHSDTTGFSVYLNSLEKRFADKIKYKKAPGFKIKDRQGNEYVSSKMTDKVIVLNFWGIGCGPCVAEIPELNKLVNKYKNSNVVFIALTYDKDDVLDKFLEKHSFDYNIVNTAWYLAKKFNVSGIPRHFVVKNGEIVKSVLGAKPDIVNELSKAIDKALTED
ncbi:MAG: TlpA family protein disulfide reductase, partial [Chlorobi bacterium]|nr:TlpA family protein disulfide reductase [Chlorobiota bacterium]